VPDPESADLEIEAIAAVSRALAGLGADARRRVVAFVADKYGLPYSPSHGPAAPAGSTPSEGGGTGHPSSKYAHFAQLANRVRPETDLHRVLLAAYWVQQVDRITPFGTKQINPRLVEISAGLGHVTERLQDLQDLRPSLVIHIKQPGQSGKSYLVTDEGMAEVDSAIDAGGFSKSVGKGKEH
jgi:hypothetical protein